MTVTTLQRLEAGDPSVSIGIVATALWLIQRDAELSELAAPAHDRGAIELDVRKAVELGRARAHASAEPGCGQSALWKGPKAEYALGPTTGPELRSTARVHRANPGHPQLNGWSS